MSPSQHLSAQDLFDSDQLDLLRSLLFDGRWLAEEVNRNGLDSLLKILEQVSFDDDVRLLQIALKLSAHRIVERPMELTNQLVGRLFGYRDHRPTIATLLDSLPVSKADWRLQSGGLLPAGGPIIRVLFGHVDHMDGMLGLKDGRIVSWAHDFSLRFWSPLGIIVKVIHGDFADNDTIGMLELHNSWVVSWHTYNVLHIWTANGEFVRSLEEPTKSAVWGALELQDGRLLTWNSRGDLHLWSATGELLRFVEVDGGVAGACVLQDGRVLTHCSDLSLRLWSPNLELLVVIPEAHKEDISNALHVRELSDGTFVSWEWLETIRVWTTEGHLLRAFPLSIPVQGVLALSTGHLLVWAQDDPNLYLWRPKEDQLLHLEGHTGPVASALELSDGRLFSWSEDGTLRLWSAAGEASALLEKPHLYEVTHWWHGHLFELVDGRLILLTDHKLHIWSSTGSHLKTLEFYIDSLQEPIILKTGLLLSAYSDKLYLWSLDTKLYDPETIDGHHGDIIGLKLLTDTDRILTWGGDGRIKFRTLDTRTEKTLMAHSGAVNDILLLRNGTFISCSNDRTLRLWNPTGEMIAEFVGHTGGVSGVLQLKDGRFLSWGWDMTLRLWSASGESLNVLSGHTKPVVGVLLLPNGNFISWAIFEPDLRLWSSEGKLLTLLENDNQSQHIPAILLRDGRICFYSDKKIKLWSQQGELLQTLAEHPSQIYGLMQRRDDCLLIWSADNIIRIWTREGEPVAVLHGHTDTVKGLIELADQRLLSWEWDLEDENKLILWSREGQLLHVLKGHTALVLGAFEFPDGRLLSWAKDCTLRLWSGSGAAMQVFYADTAVTSIVFDERTQILYAGAENGRVLALRLPGV